ncbi:hypothetical protein R1flu_011718 [Riccia fluitans]|uniref:Uncharacterized protein n=1 Tax=Riccia fluitans TaxID=41844 RepID=A0ABD1Z8Y3_9MARC
MNNDDVILLLLILYSIFLIVLSSISVILLYEMMGYLYDNSTPPIAVMPRRSEADRFYNSGQAPPPPVAHNV